MTHDQSRRMFLKSAVMSSAALAALSFDPPHSRATQATRAGNHWLSALGTSVAEKGPQSLPIEGRLPHGVAGTLYRNGPGLFERAGYRKGNLLDGDGLLQALTLADGKATYRNRFVRTEKYREEEAAGRLLYSTWTTQAPGGMLNALGGGEIKTQAGVTTYRLGERLFALDEVSPLYELDPVTLETKGPFASGMTENIGLKAHTKIDGETGDWIMLGQNFGRTMTLEVAIHKKDGQTTTLKDIAAPRQTYVHDFFVTRSHVLVTLHPSFLSTLKFLTGMASFTDSLNWTPQEGNLLVAIPKDGSAIKTFELPAAWMWHSVNAYDQGNTIIADFVGYEEPDHMFGDEAAFKTIMNGKVGKADAPGHLRRYVLNMGDGTAREDIIHDGNFEFPIVAPSRLGHPYRHAYMSTGPGGGIFHSAIAHVDVTTSKVDAYDFGPQTHVGEPIFIPAPGTASSLQDKAEAGWLITQALDGKTGTSYFAILRADAVADGPIARLQTGARLPLSFHGWWHGA